QGVVQTVPFVVAQAAPPLAPKGQCHQFSLAFTAPVLRLSTPMPREKLLNWTFSWPAGALKPTSMASFSKVFCETTVPVMRPLLKMLIAVGPGVGAPGLSGPLPEKKLPMMELSFRLTGGAGAGGAAWLCMATPVAPLSRMMLLITTLPVSVVPGEGAKMPTPAPGDWVPFRRET